MTTANLAATAGHELRLQIAEEFDFAAAKQCLRQCREDTARQPTRLTFDLTRTRRLHTLGLGTMLYIVSRYGMANGNATIVYADPAVGDLLKMARLDRWFQLLSQRRRHGDVAPAYPTTGENTPCD